MPHLLDNDFDLDTDIINTFRAAGYGRMVAPQAIVDDEQDLYLPLDRWSDRKVARSVRST